MICNVCEANVERLYLLSTGEYGGIWGCDKCMKLYKKLLEHYSRKGYGKDRILQIMKGIIARQKASGKW